MNSIAEKLSSSPDVVHECSNDIQIKEFLTWLGISGNFTPKPEGSKETVTLVRHFNNKTHFILIGLWRGYDDTSQNGYRIWCIPRTTYSIEQFEDLCKVILEKSSDNNRILDAGTFRSEPGNISN